MDYRPRTMGWHYTNKRIGPYSISNYVPELKGPPKAFFVWDDERKRRVVRQLGDMSEQQLRYAVEDLLGLTPPKDAGRKKLWAMMLGIG